MQILKLSAILPLVLAAAVADTPGAAAEPSAAAPRVAVMRTPNGGIQPQAAVDAAGNVHLIYFKGDPAAGDIFYVRRSRQQPEFSAPIRVNSFPASAVAMGTIRGAQLAIGRGGRVHVVWNGSKAAQPRVDGVEHDTPMLYARLSDSGDSFEPQRNLIRHAHGLDGGGSVAADPSGNVFVTWHANPAGDGEGKRRVYLAVSRDDGATFAPESAISPAGTGVCGCCGMKAFVDHQGCLLVLYRSATDDVGRNMYLLSSKDLGRSFQSQIVDAWEVARCPMSSAAFAQAPAAGSSESESPVRGPLPNPPAAGEVVAAWETADQVYFGWYDGQGGITESIAPNSVEAAHPAAAVNTRGEALFVWTEGTGWNRGGAVAWQLYDAERSPTAEHGSRQGVPVWSLPTAITNPDGDFTVIY